MFYIPFIATFVGWLEYKNCGRVDDAPASQGHLPLFVLSNTANQPFLVLQSPDVSEIANVLPAAASLYSIGLIELNIKYIKL